MAGTKRDDLQKFYVCGNCHIEIGYPATDEPPTICPECTYAHHTRLVTGVPSQVKVDLTQL